MKTIIRSLLVFFLCFLTLLIVTIRSKPIAEINILDGLLLIFDAALLTGLSGLAWWVTGRVYDQVASFLKSGRSNE